MGCLPPPPPPPQLLPGAEEPGRAGTSCATPPPPLHQAGPITTRHQRAVTVPVAEAAGRGRLRHTLEEPPPPPSHWLLYTEHFNINSDCIFLYIS